MVANVFKFLLCWVATLILLNSNAYAKDFSDTVKKALHINIARLMSQHDIPGANVGIWIPGEGEWAESFGVADKSTGRKLKFSDHFRIGSITKTFVTTGILQLADQGKISLEDTIDKYVDNVPNGNSITLLQLANMTSGLPNYSEDEEWNGRVIYTKGGLNVTSQDLLDQAFKMPMMFEPGKGWHYSNTNTVLLGLVIEKVSGLYLGEFLKKNIFIPLGLKETSYPNDATMPEPFAHGYTVQTLDKKEDDRTFNNPSWTNAAGQMISTFGDLKVWAKALGTGALLRAETFKERMTNFVTMSPDSDERQYGIGIFLNQEWVGHAGKLPGYNCLIAYLPANQAIFVVTVNSDIDKKVEDQTLEQAGMIFEQVLRVVMPRAET